MCDYADELVLFVYTFLEQKQIQTDFRYNIYISHYRNDMTKLADVNRSPKTTESICINM